MKEKYGYTHQYILWGQPWILFILEMADEARYIKGSPPEQGARTITDLEESAKHFNR